jgi:hypothetical protein
MSLGQKKPLDFRCFKFVIIPNSKVYWCKNALGVGDNFGSAFFLCNSMHCPTSVGKIVRNAPNMLELLLHFGFLYSSDTAKIQTSRREWCNLDHGRGGPFDDGRQR